MAVMRSLALAALAAGAAAQYSRTINFCASGADVLVQPGENVLMTTNLASKYVQ